MGAWHLLQSLALKHQRKPLARRIRLQISVASRLRKAPAWGLLCVLPCKRAQRSQTPTTPYLQLQLADVMAALWTVLVKPGSRHGCETSVACDCSCLGTRSSPVVAQGADSKPWLSSGSLVHNMSHMAWEGEREVTRLCKPHVDIRQCLSFDISFGFCSHRLVPVGDNFKLHV